MNSLLVFTVEKTLLFYSFPLKNYSGDMLGGSFLGGYSVAIREKQFYRDWAAFHGLSY